jgi:hypothetical protein
MRDLRLTQPVALILANSIDTAADLGIRLRDARCVAVEPRTGESAIQAIIRLRPSLVLVELGHRDLFGGGLWGVANENDAAVLMFGREATDVSQAESRYGVRVISLDAPAKDFRAAIAGVSTPSFPRRPRLP